MKQKRNSRLLQKLHSLPNAVFVLIIVFAAFSLAVPNFFTGLNISTMLQQACILCILSAAMSISIMANCIDLSVGGLVSFLGAVIVIAANGGVPAPLAILLGLVVAAAFGTVTGLIVVKMKIPPFIATFAMMGVAEALANTVTDSKAIYLDTSCTGGGLFTFLNRNIVTIPLGGGDALVLNNMVILAFLTIAAIMLLFNRTGFGGRILAIGHNKEAAKLLKINVTRDCLFTYILSAVAACIAALLMVLRSNAAQPTGGSGLEFQAVVAAVLGGNLLSGGKGSVGSGVIGALIIFALRTGLQLAGYNTNLVMVALGVALILSVVLNEVDLKIIRRKRV